MVYGVGFELPARVQCWNNFWLTSARVILSSRLKSPLDDEKVGCVEMSVINHQPMPRNILEDNTSTTPRRKPEDSQGLKAQ